LKRSQLINELALKAGFNKNQTANFINAFSETIYEAVQAHGKALISGLGTFQVKNRQPKKIVHP